MPPATSPAVTASLEQISISPGGSIVTITSGISPRHASITTIISITPISIPCPVISPSITPRIAILAFACSIVATR
ncbi:MAG: hypothetical protein L6R40_007718 [Gallowayella cf. fulva]|nr:MAG: hypothetical protein L6R40_007718 [Xanthomendoza cf. fulva]